MDNFYKFYRQWTNLKPLNFIFVTTVVMILLTAPISIVLDLLEVSEYEFGGFDTAKYNTIALIFMVLVLVPILETFIAQLIPITLSQSFIKNNPNRNGIILSTIIFSTLHIGYSVWYAITVLPAGFLFAYTFVLFQKRKESGFWVTSSLHSFRNLIPLILTISDRYFT